MNNKISFSAFIIDKNKTFWTMLFINPFFLILSALFVLGKLATNLVMGAIWVNALRSGLMGFIFYILACYLVVILSVPVDERPSEDKVRLMTCFRRIIVLFLFLLLILSIHVLYCYGLHSGKNSYSEESFSVCLSKLPVIL